MIRGLTANFSAYFGYYSINVLWYIFFSEGEMIIMSNLLNGMKNELNYTETFNGGTAYKSTLNGVLDLFAMGGALRCREKQDKIDLFYRRR